MPARKFFVGDLVEFDEACQYMSQHSVTSTDGQRRMHQGLITKTTIATRANGRMSVLYYTVDCECGKELRPHPHHINLIAAPTDETYAPIRATSKLENLLAKASVPVDATMPTIAQVNELLDAIPRRYQTVLRLRFGIDIDGDTKERPMTLVDVGTAFGLTRQRIQQMEKLGLEKIHAAHLELGN